MAKALFYRLFGFGKIPVEWMSQLQAEGILLLDEGLQGSVTLHHFHRPGKSTAWERRGFIASLALARARLLALNGSRPVIDVPLTDERFGQMRFTLEKSETLQVAFDAGLFHPDWSGPVEYRFRTPQAQHFLDSLPK